MKILTALTETFSSFNLNLTVVVAFLWSSVNVYNVFHNWAKIPVRTAVTDRHLAPQHVAFPVVGICAPDGQLKKRLGDTHTWAQGEIPF